jgi:hypothetical protein
MALQMHEKNKEILTTDLREFVMHRGGLKSYLAKAESLGAEDCDVFAEKKDAYIDIIFKARGLNHPGHYHLVLGPQGRVVSKETDLPSH